MYDSGIRDCGNNPRLGRHRRTVARVTVEQRYSRVLEHEHSRPFPHHPLRHFRYLSTGGCIRNIQHCGCVRKPSQPVNDDHDSWSMTTMRACCLEQILLRAIDDRQLN